MKLKRFIGKRIRGYMNFDIEFNDSLTFLIGINGSGKTTVLKLLSGLLTPSYSELSQIDFVEISIFFEIRTNNFKIRCTKEGNIMTLYYYSISDNLKSECVTLVPLNNNATHGINDVDNYELKHLRVEFENTKTVDIIRKIDSPLFLELNRRATELNLLNNMQRRNMLSHRNSRSNVNDSLDSVDNALKEVEMMLFNRIRQTAMMRTRFSDEFRNEVFRESIKPVDNNLVRINMNVDSSIEIGKLPERKQKLNEAIENLNIRDLSHQFTVFFENIENILTVLGANEDEKGDAYYDSFFKWMISLSQIEKIDNIIEYANKHTEKTVKLNNPINGFTKSANIFFKEGGKAIEVDGQGNIEIKIEGKTKSNTIYELSSGEKQLIIMLAYAAFHKSFKIAPIFVIDEPELSLHISWQELFVDALLKASPETQFIIATHAPAILSRNERRELCVDLSKKY